jgi:hypothetical protein
MEAGNIVETGRVEGIADGRQDQARAEVRSSGQIESDAESLISPPGGKS